MTTALSTGIELFSAQSFGKMVLIESSFVFPRVLMFPETKGTKQYKFGIGDHFRFINRCPTCRQVMSSLRRKICAQHRWHMDSGAVSRIGRKVDYEQALLFLVHRAKRARHANDHEGARRPRFSSRGFANRRLRACSPLR